MAYTTIDAIIENASVDEVVKAIFGGEKGGGVSLIAQVHRARGTLGGFQIVFNAMRA